LRPAYGLLFNDYLIGYDYWGHCDFDVIWGDLRNFFDTYHIEEYDRFLPLGHLCLYRNDEENNRRFMLSGSRYGYKKVFTSEKNFAFDEMTGIGRIYLENNFKVFHNRIFADISNIYKRYRLAMGDINYEQQVFFWRDGKVYRAYMVDNEIKEEEFIYIHFKERGQLPFEKECLASSMFFITYNGFYAGKMPIRISDIESYNPFPGTAYEKAELNTHRKARRIRIWKHRFSKILGIKEAIR
jgi:hypothetical protein